MQNCAISTFLHALLDRSNFGVPFSDRVACIFIDVASDLL